MVLFSGCEPQPDKDVWTASNAADERPSFAALKNIYAGDAINDNALVAGPPFPSLFHIFSS
jgi:hypothetical protein